MSVQLSKVLPDAECLLALQPEELGLTLLPILSAMEASGIKLNRYSYGLQHTVQDYPENCRFRVQKALMEAWSWLENEGLLAPLPGEQGEWRFVTRKGHQVCRESDSEAYRKASTLPRVLLHATIVEDVWGTYLRGDYDTAVFQAMKAVEVAVREASAMPATEIGVNLMRKAFDKTTGPLSDMDRPEAEREAISSLFAGAIGAYKNPQSHRRVALDDPAEAAQVLVLASHLLSIVDSRRPRSPESRPVSDGDGGLRP